MRIQGIKKAFTLIELLVVITIIGILATGATTVYTSQIQKARDTTRINDMKALQSAIEQVYQDNSEYPYSTQFVNGATGVTGLLTYMEKLPSDPKHGQPCNDGGITANAPDCAYSYIVGPDNNNIQYGEYEISTAFEAEGNVDKKAALDGGGTGIELSRLEMGLDIASNNSGVAANAITTVNPGVCTLAGAVAGTSTSLVVINGNPSSGNECN